MISFIYKKFCSADRLAPSCVAHGFPSISVSFRPAEAQAPALSCHWRSLMSLLDSIYSRWVILSTVYPRFPQRKHAVLLCLYLCRIRLRLRWGYFHIPGEFLSQVFSFFSSSNLFLYLWSFCEIFLTVLFSYNSEIWL